MSARKPLIYLGLFAALAAFYYFYEYKGGQERTAQEEREKKALLFSADSADTFSLYALGLDSASVDTINLVKKDNAWRIVFPFEAEADSEAVARLLDNASRASRNRVVEDSAADLKIFGLDRPQLIFEVSPRPGGELQRLALGNKNPGETYIYAANLAEPSQVILLNSWVLSDLKKDVFTLRDKKLLKLDKASVGRLVLNKAGAPALELNRTENDWKLVQPLGGLADRDSVNNLLDKITGAKAAAFEDSVSAGELTSFGLKPPAWSVELFEKESGAQHTLELGGNDDQGRYYARRAGLESVALIDSELVNLFNADPGRLRDRKLVAAGRDSILQIALESVAGAWQLEKDSAGVWSFARPERARADGTKIDGYLWDIKDLVVKSFDPRPPEDVSRRLVRPDFTLSLTGRQGSETLAFLRASAGDSLFYVKSSWPVSKSATLR
ncbi:MAG TPA: DUF4340 domain-containing protein, partial [Candidatus Glassbacteria bacterium]|nr:DUF4340 domain-containing protein [Candidatus Glassbacteria bacterium]